MRHNQFVGIGLLGILLASGCAGKGERIDLKVPIVSAADEKGRRESSATVAIQPLKTIAPTDRISAQESPMGRGESFSIPSGTSVRTAQAFAEYLKGKGWNATVAMEQSRRT